MHEIRIDKNETIIILNKKINSKFVTTCPTFKGSILTKLIYL